MNKLFTKIAALALGATMAVGVGVAIGSSGKAAEPVSAADVLEYTLDGTDSTQGSNGYATDSEVTQSSVKWEVTANTTINPWRFGGKNITDTDRKAVSTQIVSSSNITKVEITTGSATATVNSVSLLVGSTKGGSEIETISKTSGLTNTTLTFTRGTGKDWTGRFFTIVFNVTCGGSNQYIQMTKAEFYKDGSAPQTYTVSYDANASTSSTNVDITNLPSPHTGLADETVQPLSSTGPSRWGYNFGGWSLTAGGTSAVNSVTIDGADVTVYAIWTADTTVTGAHASNPYTVAQARAAIDAGQHLYENYVSGKISQIDSYNSNHSSITYWISDNGTTSNQLQVYGGKGLNNVGFTAITDIQTFADVVVTGLLKKYNSTYEFDADNYLASYSYTPPAVTHTVTFDVNGGDSSNPADQTVGDGLTFVFPSAGTKTGYICTGWTLDEVTFYQEGQTSPAVDDDWDFYAMWQLEGSPSDPYTVAEAIDAIDNNTGLFGASVSGIISEIPNNAFQNNCITYSISDDGNTTNQLEVYKGKGLNNIDFTAVSDIEVGATVTVLGHLKLYNNTKHEFDSGNYLTSYTAPAPATLESIEITGSMTKTSYSTTENWDPSGLIVTAYYDNSTSAIVTGDVTWSYSPATPSAMGAGTDDLTVTATYSGFTDDVTVSVTVTSSSYVDTFNLSGRQIIFEQQEANGTCYYMNIDSASTSVKPTAPTSKASASIFLFTLVGNDTFTITNEEGTMGLYQTGSTNTVLWGSNGTSYHWLVNDTQAGELYGDYNLIGQTANDNQRYLCVYNNSDWRTYSSATATNRKAMIQLEVPRTVSGFSVYSTGANKNVLKGTTFNATAAAEAGFQARLNYTDSTYDDVTASATWTLDTSIVNNNATLTVTYESYTAVEITGMNVYAVIITSLTIDSSSAQTTYYEGDTLNTAGLVITGHDSSNNNYSLTIGDCVFSPANGTVLSTSNTSVTVTYTNDDSSQATGSYSITVNAFAGYSKVTSLSGVSVGDSYVIGGIASTNLMGTYTTTGSGNSTKYIRQIADGSAVVNSTYTKVNSLPSGAVEITFLSDGEGGYYIYDLTSDAYLQTGSGTATLKNVASISQATVWTISFDATGIKIVDSNDHCLEYNNQSPRFANYVHNSSNYIALYKKTGSSIKTADTTFANTYLKMNDPAYEGDISTPNCESNYAAMKTAYVALSDNEKNVFQYSSDFAAARARLEAWAIANHETFTYGAAEPFARIETNPIAIVSSESGNATAIVVIISVISVSAIGGYFFLRKRREEN